MSLDIRDPPTVGPWPLPGPNQCTTLHYLSVLGLSQDLTLTTLPPSIERRVNMLCRLLPNLSVTCPPFLARGHAPNPFWHGAIISTATFLAWGHNRHHNQVLAWGHNRHHNQCNTTLWQPIGPGEFSSPKHLGGQNIP